MTRLAYQLGEPLGTLANLGLIVLRTDETIEHEFRQIMPQAGVGFYTTRIPCETEVTPEALARMETALPAAAALLPHSIGFDTIGYACTSGATVIGPDRVAEQVRTGAKTRNVTDPLSAVLDAFKALELRQIGFLSPYVADVSAKMRDILTDTGIDVSTFGTFEEESDENIARITPDSIYDAARIVGQKRPVDAVFISCTNLRTLALIPALESELGVPIITSNLALAWHMLSLSDVETKELPFGALMSAQLR